MRVKEMGNVQGVERSESYEIAKEDLGNRNRERTDEGPQLDASSLIHDSYFTSLMITTAKENRGFWGPTAEDIDMEPILRPPWSFPMNINLNVSAEPLVKQKPPEKQWSKPPTLNKEKVEKPFKYAIPSTEVADEGREHKTDSGNSMAGHLVMTDATGVRPQTLGFSFGTFPNESPLYSPGMISVDTHLAELPIICSDGHQITHQEELEEMGTKWKTPTENQTLKAADTNATNQGRSLDCSSSPALESLPNVTQQPNDVLNPLDATQTTEQTNKAHPLSSQRTLKNITGHSGTETSINAFALQDRDAEKITQEAADTHCNTKTSPTEDGSMSILQPSLCTVQTKVDEEAQIKSTLSFSYADVLKRSPKTAQPWGICNKNEELVGRQNTTHKATRKAASLSNVSQISYQVNSKYCGTESSKKITKCWKPTEPSTPPFKVNKPQLGFQWTSPWDNTKGHSQFKGSWNMAKHQAFTPNNTLNFGSTWTVSKNISTGKAQEHANPDKDKVYQSYPIERRSKCKLVCHNSLTCIPKEPVKSKPVVSSQPQEASPQTPESTLPVKPPEDYTISDVSLENSDQIIKSPAPEEPPVIKPNTPQLMPMSDVLVTSAEEHIDASDLGNSCTPVPQEARECPESKDQIPDQSLVVVENKSASDPTTGLQVRDSNVGVEKTGPNEAPECQPSGRWKDFYVDNHCTMKCICRHRPGKLPPNVVRWFSVSQNKLAEPMWVTTLKVASSLVAGTRLLLERNSSRGSEMNSTAPNKHPK
ncbi:gametogenetin [Phyllobates terribilis]|uniref:gametogenetin n=1 Tax=Phyllobates terribilis TaxID=111132 RepID=UPI003CCB3E89